MKALVTLLVVLVSLVLPGTASAFRPIGAGTCTGGLDDAGSTVVGVLGLVGSQKHRGNVYDYGETASGSSNAARGASQAAKAVDPNKLHHIFGFAKHKLGPLLDKFGGSQEAAFRAVEGATQTAVKNQGLTGAFKTMVEVGGQNVVVKGTVIDSTAHIGSFWIP